VIQLPERPVWAACALAVPVLVLGSVGARADTTALRPSSAHGLGPGQVVRAYVSAVHRGARRSAYALLAPGTGYRSYANIDAAVYGGAVERLEVAPYRIRVAGGTYTCVGVQQANILQPDRRPLRGWYVMRDSTDDRWGVVLHGSDLQVGAPFFVPARSGCRAVVTASGSPSECDAIQLRATAWLQGAGSTRVGLVTVHNRKRVKCVLKGFPSLALGISLRGAGPVRLAAKPTPASANSALGTDGPSTVLLPVGYGASALIHWINWCHSLSTLRVRMTLTVSGRPITVVIRNNPGSPPCLSQRRRSALMVGQFQPLSPF